MTRLASQLNSVDASHSSPRVLPDGRASTFDVRSWLAGLVKWPADEMRYVIETERRGRRTVTYAGRVVLPAGTRFTWRPRGVQT